MRFEYSAGGVVFKKEGDTILLLVGQHSQHEGWVFPKGIIGDKIQGERKEESAIREVKEETGIDAEIIEELTTVQYWYMVQKEKHKKTVYYFLMKYLGGRVEERDFELQEVEWLPIDEVKSRLTYRSDKKVFAEARERLAKLENL